MKKLRLQEMAALARARGGRCLSDCYQNNATKLAWQCSRGHEWAATTNQIKKGHWCPTCAKVARLSMRELRGLASQRGGECLSLEYRNSSSFLLWKCAFGHEWIARTKSIRAGNWCPVCARNRRLRLGDLQRIAADRGGKCLSPSYANGRIPLFWECAFGHRWSAPAGAVKSGSRRKGTWCPQCYNQRRRFRAKQDLKCMQDAAAARGGRCVSTEYVNSKAKLTWRCARGHEWRALSTAIFQGNWCPFCARNQRLGLSQMQHIAAARGGACLSQEYRNERTALWWRCAASHEWRTTPNIVKRGSWCPVCAHASRRRNAGRLPQSQEVVDFAPSRHTRSKPNRGAARPRPTRVKRSSRA
jgi:hypothetical protein